MDDFVDQSKVFFRCTVCEFEFQADPNFIPIKCPQCGSEENYRIWMSINYYYEKNDFQKKKDIYAKIQDKSL